MSTADKSTNVRQTILIALVLVVSLVGIFGYVGNEPAANTQTSSQGGWGS